MTLIQRDSASKTWDELNGNLSRNSSPIPLMQTRRPKWEVSIRYNLHKKVMEIKVVDDGEGFEKSVMPGQSLQHPIEQKTLRNADDSTGETRSFCHARIMLTSSRQTPKSNSSFHIEKRGDQPRYMVPGRWRMISQELFDKIYHRLNDFPNKRNTGIFKP